MFRFVLALSMCLILASTTSIWAAEGEPLGKANIAVKVDHIQFTDNVLDNVGLESDIYYAIEGFVETIPNLYLGIEVGYTNPKGSMSISGVNVKTENTYIPIELNLKYVFVPAKDFSLSIGTGASFNYIKEELKVYGTTIDDDDWLLGGQLFCDANYNINNFFVGLNAKFQLTEEMKNYGYDYTNWRVGGQVGFKF